jgi:hypothetical protein
MNIDNYLEAIEAAHRRRCERFCYVATRSGTPFAIQPAWRVSIAEAGKPGYYPLSDDYFVGTEAEAHAQAEKLNFNRLGIGPREAALIVASSMAEGWGRRT